ncbi:outer membrane protein assembly factor BamD [Parahaliea sp. F7430]|uniref:Outer membrane protein assembly factor BamD n=1 Tax=Sediminihaliea albiluteola TaxID=2758564 RepID=A0A7W2YLE5_9GAMM|nr:outer membrane protein assembly factor BamD [Sediminihaliea albiluteola]MBA6414318.1 outer membrane protein assembly factor BamD [Sediminihaliea albiluteola]
MKSLKIIASLLLAASLVACSSNDEMSDLGADAGEQQMYMESQRYLNSRNFDLAVRSLQLLESRYPFGKYAEQAQLELIYAHYSAYEHEAAVEAADRFIRLHPQHPNVDYAYYMKGLSAYSANQNIFARFLPTDITKRDTSQAKEAFAEFAQLLSRYPNSPYAADAKARMLQLRNLLARHEINVANYYFRRGAYLAAVNRGRFVVEHFQRTPAVADGLAVMAQGYILLGMNDLAQDSIDVLALNYPDHPSLNDKGEFDSVYSLDGIQRSWINKASFGLFDPPEPPQFDNRLAYE